MRALCLALGLSLLALPVWANARVTVLMDVLKMSQVIDILRTEGLTYAEVLDTDFLQGKGGPFWQAQVSQIYAPDPMSERVRAALTEHLSQDDVEAAIAFFGTEFGSRIIDLENAARRALADPAVEEAAREIFAERAGGADPLVAQVGAFIEANDLIERNISGAMSSNFQFYKGLSDGGHTKLSEAEIVEEVWSQQEDIRHDTEDWLNAFLLLAYQPLRSVEMQAYVDYSASEEGQALNAALFDGFEAVYRDVSYALGRAVALNAKGDEI